MRFPPALRLIDRLRLSAMVLICLAITTVAGAQALRFGFGAPNRTELTAPQVNVVSGPLASRLEQARALAANKHWDDAVDILRELATDPSDAVVELDEGRFVNLRTYSHLQLARLPAEALATYRRRVDPLAERWYRDGLLARDESLLRRVVDEMFCSSWGDDALLALGEMALERADYAAARRSWEQISPLLRAPNGRPLWIALHNIALEEHWPEIERRWAERPQPLHWLAYPDTNLELADVRARLVLVSIRAGQLKRAELELNFVRRFHPTARGQLGGQHGPYVAALERLIVSAGDWPPESTDSDWSTFAGSPQRISATVKLGPITGPTWPKPVPLTPSVVSRAAETNSIRIRFDPDGRAVQQPQQMPVRESDLQLSLFPVVAGGVVYCGSATQIHAVDLDTGRPAFTRNGILHRGNGAVDSRSIARSGLRQGIWRNTYPVEHGVPRHTFTIVDGILYARLGRIATASLDPRAGSAVERLVGLDLERDGLLTFSAEPEDPAWAFDGVPVGDGRRLFVAMRRSEVTPHAYVACFDVATGKRLWRTAIGAADTPAAGVGDEITHNLLTFVGDRVYFNTNLGLIASLDAETGAICWMHRYDRAGEPLVQGRPGPLHFDRDPSPCLVYDGLVIVAPADTPEVLALDADTGQTVWSNDEMTDALHLLGVVRQNLIVGGNRLRGVDLRTGKLRFTWPESEHAGIRGMGRGLVAGDEIFWPTRNEIHVIHGVTGARSRQPINLHPISDHGANLAAAQGRLLIAGHDRLMAFGPALPVPPNKRENDNKEPLATSD